MSDSFNLVEEGPVSKAFDGLTKNQKMAFANFLFYILLIDKYQRERYLEDELTFIWRYRKILNVTGEECFGYYTLGGHECTISELKQLNHNHKELLVTVVIELICSGGGFTQDIRDLVCRELSEIDIDDDMFSSMLVKKKKAPHC